MNFDVVSSTYIVEESLIISVKAGRFPIENLRKCILDAGIGVIT